jgi:hypothetical protein
MYFIPSPSDLHIGYELEIFHYHKYKNKWENMIIGNNHDMKDILYRFEDPVYAGIRTPYLSTSQLEKEGWSICYDDHAHKLFENNEVMLYKEGWFFYMNLNNHEAHLISNKGEMCFKGTIESINEFRIILSLIEIKKENVTTTGIQQQGCA